MRCLLTFREVMASWRATTLLPEVEGRHALCTVLEGETHRKQAFCTLRRHGIMTERLEESVDEKCKMYPSLFVDLSFYSVAFPKFSPAALSGLLASFGRFSGLFPRGTPPPPVGPATLDKSSEPANNPEFSPMKKHILIVLVAA